VVAAALTDPAQVGAGALVIGVATIRGNTSFAFAFVAGVTFALAAEFAFTFAACLTFAFAAGFAFALAACLAFALAAGFALTFAAGFTFAVSDLTRVQA
jgi:hypothetical protein